MLSKRRNRFSRLYRRIFRPNGIVLGDVRQYVAGDDVRLIDWKASAKLNTLVVDSVADDIGSDIIFVVDVSSSIKAGLQGQGKMSLIMDIVSRLCHLSGEKHDKCGLAVFSDRLEEYCPATYRSGALLHTLTRNFTKEKKLKTNLCAVLPVINQVIKKRSIIVLICDIFALCNKRKSVLSHLHSLRSKHDVIVMAITDDSDLLRHNIGTVVIGDAETDNTIEINTNDANMMNTMFEKFSEYKNLIFRDLSYVVLKVFEVNTRESPTDFLDKFFCDMLHK